ncbi:MAG: aldo/keto reductase [Oscillospiraceae bacterium]|nr:aldo/keto reductase [Oscillospiraceae bacterium]
MRTITLGRTGLEVSAVSLGCLPIQRVPMDEAVRILRKAYDSGITYYDTANRYTDSEEKIGNALSDVRHNIIISTKTGATDKATAQKHIENSLRMMKTDYIDIIQFHNPKGLPDRNDPNSPWAAFDEAVKKGYVRYCGITNHSADTAKAAVLSGDYDTVQYPFSYISTEKEVALTELCKEHNVGFIAMKGLCGGMLTNSAACYAFARAHDNVVPIWGVQTMEELEDWLELEKNPPELSDEIMAVIEADRAKYSGDFCRACGYCLPCAANIEIPTAARIETLLGRAPWQQYMDDASYDKMHRIDNCINCRACASRCPYGLDTPALLKHMLAFYDAFYHAHGGTRGLDNV